MTLTCKQETVCKTKRPLIWWVKVISMLLRPHRVITACTPLIQRANIQEKKTSNDTGQDVYGVCLPSSSWCRFKCWPCLELIINKEIRGSIIGGHVLTGWNNLDKPDVPINVMSCSITKSEWHYEDVVTQIPTYISTHTQNRSTGILYSIFKRFMGDKQKQNLQGNMKKNKCGGLDWLGKIVTIFHLVTKESLLHSSGQKRYWEKEVCQQFTCSK